MVGRSRRFLEAVLSAYKPERCLKTWLRKLTAEVAVSCPEQFGAVARVLDTRARRNLNACAIQVADPAIRGALWGTARSSARCKEFMLHQQPGPHSVLEELVREAEYDARVRSHLEHLERIGVGDLASTTSNDGDGTLISLGLVVRRGDAFILSNRSWSMAALHLGTALRLQKRRCLEAATSQRSDDDLGSLERWRRTFRQADTTERTSAIAPERALDAWRGLVDGTWSCVDQHDRDGRRYVVAVANPPASRDARALSLREAHIAALAAEGHSDKWIAYTLGLSRSTVASHLASALGKLCVPSRALLARAFSSSEST